MARLSNPRHEAFAQYLHEGYTADEAYERAGYRANRKNAARLKANEGIQNRLSELAERAERVSDVTLQSITDIYFEAAQMARKQNDAQALRATADSMAKLHGLWVDRQQVDSTTRVVSTEPLDEDAWAAQYGADTHDTEPTTTH